MNDEDNGVGSNNNTPFNTAADERNINMALSDLPDMNLYCPMAVCRRMLNRVSYLAEKVTRNADILKMRNELVVQIHEMEMLEITTSGMKEFAEFL